MGDPYFDLGNFSINHELTPDDDANLLAAYLGSVPIDRLGTADPDARRVRLPRGDVGRPPAGHQHARRRFRRVRRRALRPAPRRMPRRRRSSGRCARRLAAEAAPRPAISGRTPFRVSRKSPLDRDELPVVRPVAQRQLEDAVGDRAELAVGDRILEARAAACRRCRPRTRASPGRGPRRHPGPGARSARSRGRGR